MKDIIDRLQSDTSRAEICRLLHEAVEEYQSARRLLGMAAQSLKTSRRRIQELLDKIQEGLPH